MYIENLRYADTHEWARLDEGTNIVTVGISAHAVKQLRDIVFLELPKTGDTFKQGDSFGAIESVKAVFELISPVTGKIVDVNQPLVDNLELLKADPYDKGWMVKIQVEAPVELQNLMSAKDYEAFIERESHKGGN